MPNLPSASQSTKTTNSDAVRTKAQPVTLISQPSALVEVWDRLELKAAA